MARRNIDTEVTDFVQALGLLVRRLRAEGGGPDLSWTQMVVLKRLEDGPATSADLARAEGMKPQSMSAIVGVLEDMDLVMRKPHPTDGRQINIVLTAKGAALRKATKDAKRNWLAQAIGKLDEEERESLFAAGGVIRRLVESDGN